MTNLERLAQYGDVTFADAGGGLQTVAVRMKCCRAMESVGATGANYDDTRELIVDRMLASIGSHRCLAYERS